MQRNQSSEISIRQVPLSLNNEDLATSVKVRQPSNTEDEDDIAMRIMAEAEKTADHGRIPFAQAHEDATKKILGRKSPGFRFSPSIQSQVSEKLETIIPPVLIPEVRATETRIIYQLSAQDIKEQIKKALESNPDLMKAEKGSIKLIMWDDTTIETCLLLCKLILRASDAVMEKLINGVRKHSSNP